MSYLPLPPAAKSYLSVVVFFLVTMTAKVAIVDKPWEHDVNIWRYVASNIIIIPIIWFAGYFFRQAEEQYKAAVTQRTE